MSSKRPLAEVSNCFECPICFEIMYSPQVGRCGHSICFYCYQQVSDTCPLCRKKNSRKDWIKNNALAQMIEAQDPVAYRQRGRQAALQTWQGLLKFVEIEYPGLYFGWSHAHLEEPQRVACLQLCLARIRGHALEPVWKELQQNLIVCTCQTHCGTKTESLGTNLHWYMMLGDVQMQLHNCKMNPVRNPVTRVFSMDFLHSEFSNVMRPILATWAKNLPESVQLQ